MQTQQTIESLVRERAKPQHGSGHRPAPLRLVFPPSAPQPTARPAGRLSLRFMAGFVLGLILMGSATVLFSVTAGAAYRPLGPTWASPVIAYSAEGDLGGYAANAGALWGQATSVVVTPGGSDIRLVYGDLLPPVTHAHQAAQANLTYYGSKIGGCEIRVEPRAFSALTAAGRQGVITHELGHCLGLDHSNVPGVMFDPLLYAFTGDDAAGMASLYPRVQQGPQSTPEAPAPAPARTVVMQRAPQPAAPPQAPRRAPPADAAAQPQSQQSPGVAAPAIPAGRPYAGALEAGWSYVLWAGASDTVEKCACEAVIADGGATWSRWAPPAPSGRTLETLVPGTSYWMLRE